MHAHAWFCKQQVASCEFQIFMNLCVSIFQGLKVCFYDPRNANSCTG